MNLDIYHATMVRRWHTNPHLSHTIDPVGYHSGRMAILALKLWPCAWELVAACLTHDLGEFASGDIPWGADNKDQANEVADQWSERNALDWHMDVNDFIRVRLKFLDRLDAYLWAKHHAPDHVAKNSDWQAQRGQLLLDAQSLGVDVKCLLNS